MGDNEFRILVFAGGDEVHALYADRIGVVLSRNVDGDV